jgi:hypothetical protein
MALHDQRLAAQRDEDLAAALLDAHNCGCAQCMTAKLNALVSVMAAVLISHTKPGMDPELARRCQDSIAMRTGKELMLRLSHARGESVSADQ